MNKFWTWLKPKLVWILTGAGIVLGGVVALLTLGQVRPSFGKKPQRPELDDVSDVEIPKVNTDFETDLNTDIAADYHKDKENPTDAASAAEELNKAFKKS